MAFDWPISARQDADATVIEGHGAAPSRRAAFSNVPTTRKRAVECGLPRQAWLH